MLMHLKPEADNPDDTIASAWVRIIVSLMFTSKLFQLAHPIRGTFGFDNDLDETLDVNKRNKEHTYNLI